MPTNGQNGGPSTQTSTQAEHTGSVQPMLGLSGNERPPSSMAMASNDTSPNADSTTGDLNQRFEFPKRRLSREAAQHQSAPAVGRTSKTTDTIVGAGQATSSDNQDVEMTSPDAENAADSDTDMKSPGGRKKKVPTKFYCTEFPPCDLAFTRSEHLARHIRKHTGERPFMCFCNRRFSRLDNLRQHAATVHSQEDIPPDSLAATGSKRPGRKNGSAPILTPPNGHGAVRGHVRNALSASNIEHNSTRIYGRSLDPRRRLSTSIQMAEPHLAHLHEGQQYSSPRNSYADSYGYSPEDYSRHSEYDQQLTPPPRPYRYQPEYSRNQPYWPNPATRRIGSELGHNRRQSMPPLPQPGYNYFEEPSPYPDRAGHAYPLPPIDARRDAYPEEHLSSPVSSVSSMRRERFPHLDEGRPRTWHGDPRLAPNDYMDGRPSEYPPPPDYRSNYPYQASQVYQSNLPYPGRSVPLPHRPLHIPESPTTSIAASTPPQRFLDEGRFGEVIPPPSRGHARNVSLPGIGSFDSTERRDGVIIRDSSRADDENDAIDGLMSMKVTDDHHGVIRNPTNPPLPPSSIL